MAKRVGSLIQNAEIIFLCFAIFLLMALCAPVWSETEVPIKLPKVEGSKSFDLEISQINSQAIKKYQQGFYKESAENFKKAVYLARQLRDPSRGIIYYNLSLSLHKLGLHEESAKQFQLARKFARGNPKILNSELLKMFRGSPGTHPELHQ